MRIIYYCKYCKSNIGQIDGQVDPSRLGFQSLTLDERADIITYNQDEDSTYVKTICDYCQSALETHPELSLVSNPLQ
ncbi:anti-sigma-F factor Fin family protein [Fodinisporobacter ferrooxydans]|uniref:Anti-sigma-F factor Fin family protein n=1 Tax=Fodinisporobacter ferrooxydans TaxID=2901836 RepID=A0ABY4CVA7_9BACL|nr:anti-sigma-F factor Fin family protein [Alicyclobacillaceae bacterium MYW30-H2]